MRAFRAMRALPARRKAVPAYFLPKARPERRKKSRRSGWASSGSGLKAFQTLPNLSQGQASPQRSQPKSQSPIPGQREGGWGPCAQW